MLYALTGSLYMLGIEGGDSQEFEYIVKLENGWPEDKDVAKQIMQREMLARGHDLKFPEAYYFWEGMHDWYGFKREILLIPEGNEHNHSDGIELKITEHNFWKQLLLIHKGHAGTFLKVFGLLWAASLLFSVVSGVVLALTLPKFKKIALATIAAGILVLSAAFLLG
jgi:hypothetical protein